MKKEVHFFKGPFTYYHKLLAISNAKNFGIRLNFNNENDYFINDGENKIPFYINDFDNNKDFFSLLLNYVSDKFDDLTKLLKREAFLELFKQYFVDLNTSFYTFAILDLDYFKLINDNYGHLCGDRVLKIFSEVLLSSINKKTTIISRYGGEEFILIYFHNDFKDGKLLLEAIRNNNNSKDYPQIKKLNFSCGYITKKNKKYKFLEELFNYLVEKSDLALYKAKAEGRGRTKNFRELIDEGIIIKRLSDIEAIINIGRKHEISPGEHYVIIDKDFNPNKLIEGTSSDFYPFRIKGEVVVSTNPEDIQMESSVVYILYESKSCKIKDGDILYKDKDVYLKIRGPIIDYHNILIETGCLFPDFLTDEVKHDYKVVFIYWKNADILIRQYGYNYYLLKIREWNSRLSKLEANFYLLSLKEIFVSFKSDDCSFIEDIFNKSNVMELIIIYFDKGEMNLNIIEELRRVYDYLKVGIYYSIKEVFNCVGINLLNNEKVEDAIKYFSKFDDIFSNINLLSVYKLKGDFDNALKRFKKIPVENHNEFILSMVGEIYTKLGNFDKAIEFFKKSLEYNKDFAVSLNNLAYCYYNLYKNDRKKLLEAKKLVEKALKLDTNNEIFKDTYNKIIELL